MDFLVGIMVLHNSFHCFIYNVSYIYTSVLKGQLAASGPGPCLQPLDSQYFHLRSQRFQGIGTIIDLRRRKTRLKEDNAKFCHLKIVFTCNGTLHQVFICLRPRTPSPPPPLHTLYSTCIKYTYSHRDGGGGGLTIEKGIGAKVNKAGSKIPT